LWQCWVCNVAREVCDPPPRPPPALSHVKRHTLPGVLAVCAGVRLFLFLTLWCCVVVMPVNYTVGL